MDTTYSLVWTFISSNGSSTLLYRLDNMFGDVTDAIEGKWSAGLGRNADWFALDAATTGQDEAFYLPKNLVDSTVLEVFPTPVKSEETVN